MFQARVAVVERNTAIESFADLDFCTSEAEAARLWGDLQAPSAPLHHVVVADHPLMREAADPLEIFRSPAPGLSCLVRGAREAAVVVGHEAAQYPIGRMEIGRAAQAEFAPQAILQHAPETLNPPLGLLEGPAELRGLTFSGEFFATLQWSSWRTKMPLRSP